MTIPLTGTNGLFTRIGKILGAIYSINTYRGTTFVNIIDGIQGQYATEDQATIDGIYQTLSSYQGSSSGTLSQLQQLAQQTIITMAANDGPQPNASLGNALTYLINQMIDNSQTVLRCAVSSSVAYGVGNSGNPTAIVSTTSNLGLPLEYVFNEIINCTVTQDSVSNGAIAGQEVISLVAPSAQGQTLSWLWPAGSGLNTNITCVSALTQGLGGQSNWLRNGNFETFTVANIPDNWTVAPGIPGTTVLQSSNAYDGVSSVEFVGTSSELTGITQQLGGTAVPSRVTQYGIFAFNLKAKTSGTPAQGVLEVALVDGSGTIIADAQGNNNVVTANLTTIGTTYASVSGFFRLPRVLPSSVNFRIRLSTALSTGTNLFIDHAAVSQPAPLYTGGPYAVVFSGNQNLVDGDTIAMTINNNYASGGFQTGFNRLFQMPGQNTNDPGLLMILPSAASGNTISDSLINT